jgi:hypothetical protein
LPNATTLNVGGPLYILDNTKGAYPAGIRDNAGTLIMAVAPGGEAMVSLRDNSTAAGVWSVTGSGLEPGLLTISSRLSSFPMVAAQPVPFVALDSNVSIHFAYWSAASFYAFVVDGLGRTVSTPITVTASGGQPVAAFKINATQAIVFFGNGANDNSAVVLTLTGSSPSYGLSVGTAANTTANIQQIWGGENSMADPKIVQLSSTLYLVGVRNASNDAAALAVGVSGTTVTIGSVSAASVATATYITTYALTATTALLIIKSGSSPFILTAQVCSVSGVAVSWGSPATLGLTSNGNTTPSSVLLSPTKAVVMDNHANLATANLTAIAIAGTAVSAAAHQMLWTASGVNITQGYSDGGATRFNPHLWAIGANTFGVWAKESGGVSRMAYVTESGGSFAPTSVAFKNICTALSGVGNGQILPPTGTEVLAVKQTLTDSAGFGLQASPTKLSSGAAPLLGAGETLRDLLPQPPQNLIMGKTSSGDYGLMMSGIFSSDNGSVGQAKLVLVRSNGERVTRCGAVSVPEMWYSHVGGMRVLPNVAANRFVLVGGGLGNSAGNSIDTLQVLNVEIAA